MQKLKRMSVTLQMDRPIDSDKHYISPGGYTVAGKCFDFCESRGYVNKENPDRVEFDLRDFDSEEYDEDITPEDLNKGFTEFFVFTGEYDEPEINVKQVLEASFEFYDAGNDSYFSVTADDQLLKNINNAL